MKEVVCAVDVGSWTFKVCVFDGKTFEVLTNEANFRETPSLVSYTHSQRLIGEEANNKVKLD
jgi:molecular chaperone DnaK (HSP70)